MSRRVFLHVGTPKSGTSYLQDKMALNRAALEAQGLEYLHTRTGDHFEAALDVIGDRWAGAEKAARGQWDALMLEARKTRRDLVISHEILAAAPPDRVRQALSGFADDEVHIVVTARDLGRQIPAEWQERIKHRGGRTYAQFLRALVRNHGRSDSDMWFWRVQDLPNILTTWGNGLTPDRLHLVTVPTSGAPSGTLWQRFAGVLSLDPDADYTESTTVNASLGGAEVTMLRRLNLELAERKLPRDVYIDWVRESIAREVLSNRPGARRATVPPKRRPWVDQVTERWLEWISQLGVEVIGDLDELRTVWPADGDDWFDPDNPDPEDVAAAAIDALAHVLDGIASGEAGAGPMVTRLARRLRG